MSVTKLEITDEEEALKEAARKYYSKLLNIDIQELPITFLVDYNYKLYDRQVWIDSTLRVFIAGRLKPEIEDYGEWWD